MRLGDILEVIAGGAFVAAAYLQWGAVAALAGGGVFLFYLAQCHARTTVSLRSLKVKVKLPRLRRRGEP